MLILSDFYLTSTSLFRLDEKGAENLIKARETFPFNFKFVSSINQQINDFQFQIGDPLLIRTGWFKFISQWQRG